MRINEQTAMQLVVGETHQPGTCTTVEELLSRSSHAPFILCCLIAFDNELVGKAVLLMLSQAETIVL